MNKKPILILGNGISRLSFDEQIKSYDGEIWGCNRVYLDYGPYLHRIAGHVECMIEAYNWRKKHGYKYRILGNLSEHTCIDDPLIAPAQYKKDTGTALVAHALTKGHEVIVCGFDLGGLDVYSPGHERLPKNQWVKRWRLLFRRFPERKVTFWGYNHKPFILSGKPDNIYTQKYTTGQPHIPDKDYEKLHSEWSNDNYQRMIGQIPFLMVKNIGARTWRATAFPHIKPGESKPVIEGMAYRMVEDYPKDFKIEGENNASGQ